ncbi:MAG: hypothetical protein QM817_23845 [Archangium sp.]
MKSEANPTPQVEQQRRVWVRPHLLTLGAPAAPPLLMVTPIGRCCDTGMPPPCAPGEPICP